VPVYKPEEAQLGNCVAYETTAVEAELFVLCEGRADCYFYRAITDAIRLDTTSRPDVRFLDGGGKYALPKLIRETRRRQKDVRVIADFDVLGTETPLCDIVEALGGGWSTFHALWREVHYGVRAQHRVPSEVVTKRDLGHRGKTQHGIGRTCQHVKRVRPGSPPWVRAKLWGRRVISEDLHDSYEALAASVAGTGLFLVKVGELEGFAPRVGHHGSRWAGQVLKRYDAATAPELEDARRFVRRVLSSPVEL
jgi:hypothetical protein